MVASCRCLANSIVARGSVVEATSAGWSFPVDGCAVVLRSASLWYLPSWWRMEEGGVTRGVVAGVAVALSVVGPKTKSRRMVPIA